MTTKIRTAALYARFSSDLQKDRSVDDQFADCERFAKREGFKIVAKFSDRAKSGSTLFGRDGALELMLAAKARKFDVVIVESLSRLARDPEDIAGIFKRLKHAEIELHTLSDGIADNMKVGLRGIIDAEYLKGLATSIKRSQGGRVREGLIPGTVPYGYDLVPGKPGERVINPEKAKIVRRIFADYANGVSPRTIALGLTRDSILSPSGAKAWNHQILARGGKGHSRGILGNRLYIGELIWNRHYTVSDPDGGPTTKRARPESEHITVSVPHLRIIDDKLWAAAHAVRNSRAVAMFGPGGLVYDRPVISRSQHFLSGLLRCGACSGHMAVIKASRGKQYVACAAAHRMTTCSHQRSYVIDYVADTVLDGMHKGLIDPKAITAAARNFHAEYAEQAKKENAERMAAERQRNKLVIQIDRIVQAIAENNGEPVPALMAAMKAKESERVGLEERLRLLNSSNVVSLHPNVIKDYQTKVEELHQAMTEDPTNPDNRIAFRNMIDSVVVQPVPRGERYDISVFGRLSAILGIDLFPTKRSNAEILAAEGVIYGDNVKPG